MPTEPATCEPPPEHAHEPFHWVVADHGRVEPMRWRGGSDPAWSYIGGQGIVRPKTAAALGWRYVGPAIPPQEAP